MEKEKVRFVDHSSGSDSDNSQQTEVRPTLPASTIADRGLGEDSIPSTSCESSEPTTIPDPIHPAPGPSSSDTVNGQYINQENKEDRILSRAHKSTKMQLKFLLKSKNKRKKSSSK